MLLVTKLAKLVWRLAFSILTFPNALAACVVRSHEMVSPGLQPQNDCKFMQGAQLAESAHIRMDPTCRKGKGAWCSRFVEAGMLQCV